MSLRIRRGTNSQRTGITFDLGEIVYTTDTQKLYIGDGVTAGGKNLLETSAGNGFTFNPTTQQIDFAIGNLNLNTAQVTESSNLYFTTERAQDAVGAALVAGNAFNTGVTFTYDDANNRITAVSTGGLTNISADTNPSLGGNLSTGAFNISGNGSITAGTITATNLGGNLSAATYNITNIGSLGATTLTATNLGGNLNTGSFNISGNGSISAGSISAGSITATNLGGNLSTGNISGGTGGIAISSTNNIPVTITGQITGGATGQLYISVRATKGTVASPITTVAGDNLGGFVISGYNGSAFQGSAIISTAWEASAVLTDAIPKSTLTLGVGGGGSTITRATLASNGVFTAPIFKATNYATSSYPTSPEKGWIIFDNTTNQFVGYNGTSWVAFA